ncbi:protein JINGUBANG [Cynara cardunculus var. scolymus]|uniref:G-protein beta WD-40 repeat-containing protein n=1 Tax=Cynara cardunculus var. scolymus TaxID=59895 RepID=A0A103XE08_CYNCS|nr:protein JINGUBANG [Cynara cardunculus var. scolymus]KVH88938.1 G-protein beta WD-40 repeat-containing protein [Cynara cardunculus var. scolymus]
MKLRSLLSTCSATICTTTTTPQKENSEPPQPKLLFYETSSTISDATTAATSPSLDTSYNYSSGSSLHSNLSLQTLPSVPSLQKFSPDTLNLTVSHGYLTSLKPSPAAHVNFLAVHNHLLYAASGNRIHVFNTTTFALLETLTVNNSSSGSVKSVTFQNGNVLTSHQDSKIRVWKLMENKRHKQSATLPTLEDRLLRSILHKNYVNVRRHRRRLWIQHQDAVTGLAVINDNLMCSVSWDKYLKIWKTSNFRCVESIKAHDDAINAVVVAADGTIYTGSADHRIKVWGKPIGENKHGLIATLEKHKSAVNALAINDAGSVLFSGACDRSILVWEKEDSANHMAVTGALRGHRNAILCLLNVSDLLFSGSADRTVRIWQRGFDGKFCCLTVLDGHRQPVRSLVADSDSQGSGSGSESIIKVFSGSFEGEIRVWKVVVSNLASPMSSHLFKLRL